MQSSRRLELWRKCTEASQKSQIKRCRRKGFCVGPGLSICDSEFRSKVPFFDTEAQRSDPPPVKRHRRLRGFLATHNAIGLLTFLCYYWIHRLLWKFLFFFPPLSLIRYASLVMRLEENNPTSCRLTYCGTAALPRTMMLMDGHQV